MKITFVWKSPVLGSGGPVGDVKAEIQKRLEDLYLDWDLYFKFETQVVYVQIKSASHRDSLRAIYRLSAPIHAGSIQLINDRVEMLY